MKPAVNGTPNNHLEDPADTKAIQINSLEQWTDHPAVLLHSPVHHQSHCHL